MFQHYSVIALIICVVLFILYLLVGRYHLSWLGKIVGFAIGFSMAQAPGGLMGVLLGHIFDSVSLARTHPRRRRAQSAVKSVQSFHPVSVEETFYFDTLFSLLGAFAVADSKVSTPYLNELHKIMQEMQLNDFEQHAAWDWFRHGQHSDFNLRQALFGFIRHGGAQTQKSHEFLKTLIRFAELQKPIGEKRYHILTTVAHTLNLSNQMFAHLAPNYRKHGNKEHNTVSTSSVEEAYAMLGIKLTATNAEIKWAYRKLMSRYHPDRLMSKDLPDEFIQLATRRTQEIKDAYQKILDSRGIKK